MSRVENREVISDEMDTEIWLSEELDTTIMHVQDKERRVAFILTAVTARELISLVDRWLETPVDRKETPCPKE